MDNVVDVTDGHAYEHVLRGGVKENQNRFAENRRDSERTDSHRPLSIDSFYGQLELILAFTEGCKA